MTKRASSALSFVFSLLLLMSATGALAQNELSLATTTPSVEVGGVAVVLVEMDFSDSTVGGGVTLDYNPAILELDSIAFDAGLGDDPDLQCPGSVAITCPGGDYISFGNITGLTGSKLVATVTFNTIASGSTTVGLVPTDAFGELGGGELAVTLSGTSVSVGILVPMLSPLGAGFLVLTLLVTSFFLARQSRSRLRTAAMLVLVLGVMGAIAAPRVLAHELDDADLDGVHDPLDNCMNTINADQRDTNVDGYGNMCDADLDNDENVDSADVDMMKAAFFGSDPDADMTGDGVVDFLDLAQASASYGGPPGPKCGSCPLPQVCGDGIVQAPEECDDGNGIDDDACTNACLSGSCGVGSFNSTFEAIQTVVFDGYSCSIAGCHGVPVSGNLDLTAGNAYASIVGVPASILPTMDRIEPGEQLLSFLYEKVDAKTNGNPTTGSPMPIAFAALSDDHLEALKLWIRGGAPEDLVVEGTEELLGACLPPADPLKIPVPDPPLIPGVQFQQTAWSLPATFEDEVCMSTYYDFMQTTLIPVEYQVPCLGFASTNNPSGMCFLYHKQTLWQDPQSHHSIIHIYDGAYDVEDTSNPGRQFGPWTYKPNDIDAAEYGDECEPKENLAATGYNPDCSGVVTSGVACIGYGVPDYSTGAAGASTAPTFGGSQEPYNELEYADGVYSVLPMAGVITWNSHAFNLSVTNSTMAQYLNLELAEPADQLYPLQGIFDDTDIFEQNVAPFGTQELCRTYLLPEGADLFQLSSHTHKRGVQFRIWEPPNAACSAGPGCNPGPPGQLIYDSPFYSDPIQLKFDPAVEYGQANADDRRFKFCSVYDNGSTPSSPEVKRQSTSPEPPLIFGLPLGPGGPCANNQVACMDGPNKGALCNGSDSFCDSTPGAADGVCDACPLIGGVTTEDEMFILTGNFYED